jgi:hypothetical protein
MKKLTKKCAKLIIHVSWKCKRFFKKTLTALKTELICETFIHRARQAAMGAAFHPGAWRAPSMAILRSGDV